MIEMLQYPFIQRAFIAAIIVGALASYYSVFIVQRRMSFVGNGLAHASFGGVALALLVGYSPLWVAAPFTVLVGLAFVWLSRNSKLESDSIIGVLFSLSMALGIIFLSWRTSYSQDAMALLFGSLLAISAEDIYLSLIVGVFLVFGIFFWRRWAFSTFDREFAEVEKQAPAWDDYLLSVFISLTVVLAIKIFGIILLSAFLVIPAASARLISRRFISMSIWSIVLGVGSAIGGVIFSYYANLPTGAAVIVTMSFVFLICFITGRFYSPR